MNDLSKDVVGMIVLKLDYIDVLNLRIVSRKFENTINNFNKFWYLRWLKRRYEFYYDSEEYNEDGFDFLKLKELVRKHVKMFKCELNGAYFKLPFQQCLCPIDIKATDFNFGDVEKSTNYLKWKEDFAKFFARETINCQQLPDN